MKIEFLQPASRRYEPTLHITVDGECVGYIIKYTYATGYRMEWNLPLASNWPPGKEKEIVQTVREKMVALEVVAKLKS